MAIIDFFKKNGSTDSTSSVGISNEQREVLPTEESSKQQETASPDVAEDVFVEYDTPKPAPVGAAAPSPVVYDLHMLYRFLEQSLEKKGYEDALVNPDTNYMEENVKHIQNNFGLLLSRVKTYYERHIRQIDFHIETRRRSGLIETVDELLAHRDSIEEERTTVNQLENEAAAGTGITQNPIFTYRKGFRNGFVAITYNTILSKRITQ